jgi:septal ring factor EnvC (AmiA/AmiB activator)
MKPFKIARKELKNNEEKLKMTISNLRQDKIELKKQIKVLEKKIQSLEKAKSAKKEVSAKPTKIIKTQKEPSKEDLSAWKKNFTDKFKNTLPKKDVQND